MKDGFYAAILFGVLLISILMFYAGYKQASEDLDCDHKKNVIIPTHEGSVGGEIKKKHTCE